MLKYEAGKIVTGRVTGIEKYGIFVSLDEFYSGLIHISEISDGFVKNISDYVNIGETIRAKIVEIDDNAYHAKLSIKNINYRVAQNPQVKLHEVAHGFQPLEDNLSKWILEKMKEINSQEE